MIPQPLPLIFPVLAAGLAGWLKDARLSQRANYAIVVAAFIVAVVLSIVLGGGLTGNPGTDIGLIVAECAAVFAALKPLMDRASNVLPSPFSKYAAQRAARLRAAEEEAAMWEAARASVPPRASAPPLQQRGIVDGTGQAMPSQPGIAGAWSRPLPQFIDNTPTVAELPAISPKPPTNPR